MHPVSGGFFLSYEPVRVTRITSVPNRKMVMPPSCMKFSVPLTLVLLSLSLWYDLNDHVFDGVGLDGF